MHCILKKILHKVQIETQRVYLRLEQIFKANQGVFIQKNFSIKMTLSLPALVSMPEVTLALLCYAFCPSASKTRPRSHRPHILLSIFPVLSVWPSQCAFFKLAH